MASSASDLARLDTRPVTQLNLIEGFELRHGDQPMVVPTSVQRLLAFLALRSRPQHRATVAGTLWMDTTEERASANLRTALWRARRVDRDLVRSTGAYLQIGDAVEVDLDDVIDRARRVLDHPESVVSWDQAGSGLDGDLLPQWYDDWVLLERERLRQLRLHSLEALCRRLAALERYGEAIEAGMAAVAGEPLRESAQRAVIEVHLTEGNTTEALRCYDAYAGELAESLDIEPTPDLRHLLAPWR
jgi:DNA-binding SARP family transcriptional activator